MSNGHIVTPDLPLQDAVNKGYGRLRAPGGRHSVGAHVSGASRWTATATSTRRPTGRCGTVWTGFTRLPVMTNYRADSPNGSHPVASDRWLAQMAA
jgi:hypothetical protein